MYITYATKYPTYIHNVFLSHRHTDIDIHIHMNTKSNNQTNIYINTHKKHRQKSHTQTYFHLLTCIYIQTVKNKYFKQNVQKLKTEKEKHKDTKKTNDCPHTNINICKGIDINNTHNLTYI